MTAFWAELDQAPRERLFTFMRDLDARADVLLARGRERHDAIPVGAGLFDDTLAGAVRLELVMALRTACSIDEAHARAKAAVRLWVEKHNARRPKDINWPRWLEAGQAELEGLVVQVRELVA